MKIQTKIYNYFNKSSTLLYVSSFPEKNAELAKENAVAWYSHQLLSSFPKNQKVVVLAEKRSETDKPWFLSKNVVVIPAYKKSSLKFSTTLTNAITNWTKPKEILIQYELNSFGAKSNTALLLPVIMAVKSAGKRVTTALHQVITEFSTMSGHVGLAPNSFSTKTINFALRRWYQAVGALSNHIIVFDQELKDRLQSLTNPEKITVIPMGMTATRLKSTQKRLARKHYGIPINATVIMAFGYQSWYKGTDWIANEVGLLNKANPKKPVHLLIAGSVSPTVENKQFAKNLQTALKKYQAHITDVGYVKENELSNCFAAADVVVYPYRAMMSASGALSQALRFEKPFLLSDQLRPALKSNDFASALLQSGLSKESIFFELKKDSLQEKLSILLKVSNLAKVNTFITQLKSSRNWKNIAKQYLNTINAETTIPTQQKNKRSNAKLSELSVFFPLYNEEENVEKLVKHSLAALPKLADIFEIILVNDGSTDTTKALAEKLAKKHSTIRVVNQANGGYGKALRTGFESARYDWVFFSDGDLQFDLKELASFIPHTAHHDVVVGYRKNRADAWNRLLLASMLKLWNRFFFSFPPTIKDIDCAFKLFNKRTISAIFPLESWGAMISTEMLLKTLDEGFEVKQVGVTHYARQFGSPTGAKPHVIIGAIKETFAILNKRYARQNSVRWWQFLRYQFTAVLLSVAYGLASSLVSSKS